MSVCRLVEPTISLVYVFILSTLHSPEVEGEYSEEVSGTDYVGGEYSEEVRGTDYVGGEYSTADDDYENYSVYSGDVNADDEVQGDDPKSIKWIIIKQLE